MAKYTNLTSLFTAIADAIRAKKGTTGKIVADNFPEEIAAIESGVKSVTFTKDDLSSSGDYLAIKLPDGVESVEWFMFMNQDVTYISSGEAVNSQIFGFYSINNCLNQPVSNVFHNGPDKDNGYYKTMYPYTHLSALGDNRYSKTMLFYVAAGYLVLTEQYAVNSGGDFGIADQLVDGTTYTLYYK